MAAERPVVATDIGPASEILGEGCGILIPVGDINRTADAVIKLIKNPLICNEMGKRGRLETKQRDRPVDAHHVTQ